MALVTIYDADGVEYQKETVDARECVNGLSFSYNKPVIENIIHKAEVILPVPVEQKTRKVKEVIIEDKV